MTDAAVSTTGAGPDTRVPALELRDLEVAYTVRGIDRTVLRGVSLSIARGEAYGLVGESGCGKSTAAYAALRYLPRNGKITGGHAFVDGIDLTSLDDRQLRELRAQKVSMVYQHPVAALNPSIKAGNQVAEVFLIAGVGKDEARVKAEEMLRRVQISDPARVMERYPHQLSGGMAQRVVIAMALASNPTLLVLDEPTTGLDATVEAEVLDLVAQLRADYGTSVLFISHNLGIIAKMCERVGVLYAGRLVEEGATRAVFDDPRHPYTVGLLRCIPRGGVRKDRDRLDTIPGLPPRLGVVVTGCVYSDRCALVQDVCRAEEPALVTVPGDGVPHLARCHFHEQADQLPRSATRPPLPDTALPAAPVVRADTVNMTFRQEGHDIRALADVSIDLRQGETLGLVGESGSGKTTLAKVLLGLYEPDEGSVLELDGRLLAKATGKREPDQVRNIQIVFQNPDSALNRRFAIRRILERAITKLVGVSGKARDDRVLMLADNVRFDERLLGVRPSQLSGGLKQRVAIARAFAGDPRVVVCDEPTSALDVSVQAAILNLLADLQAEARVTYLFISHDLGVVRFLADRIAVLYLGRIMELGDAEVVFNAPHHPYTEALLSAVPTIDGTERHRIRLEGEIPSAADPPPGCVFHTRCPRVIGEVCRTVEPPLVEAEPGHLMRCHIPLDELRELQKTPPAESPVGLPG